MLGILCAYFDLGDQPLELDRAPYGANMAFRKHMFEKYGTFRTDLDRCGGDTMSNGDTEFGRRLMKPGSDCDMSRRRSFTTLCPKSGLRRSISCLGGSTLAGPSRGSGGAAAQFWVSHGPISTSSV